MSLSTRRLFVAILFLALFAMAARNLTDPDFGWHLRTGEFIVTQGSVPETDIFSFTATGQTRVAHDWLTDALLYGLTRAGGDGALILFFALVGMFAFALLYCRCPGRPYVAGFVAVLAAIAAAPFWGVRPQTLSLFLTSLFLVILDRYRSVGAGRYLFWLVPLMLIWANAHGSFALGPTLILVYLLGDWIEPYFWNRDRQSRRRDARFLSGILLLCIAVIVINPVGFDLYIFPFQTLSSSVIQTYIQEWQPPDFHALEIQPFGLMLALTLGALAYSRRRVGLVETVLVVGFAFASLRAARQVSIWVLVAAPVLARAVNEFIETLPHCIQPPGRLSRPIPILNGVILGIVAMAVALRVASVIVDEPSAERATYPAAAVQLIEDQNLTGPVLNRYDWGGYLIWRLYPRERVFIDGRSDLYGLTGDFVVKEYIKAYQGAPEWREPLERYGIRLVLIGPDAPLATLLKQEPGWKRVYEDPLAVVFSR